MFNFLKEDTNTSTTRIVLLLGTLAACLIMVGMLYHIVIYENVKWESMSVFLLAIASYMGTLLFGKVTQKKIEKDQHKDNNIN